MKNHSLLKNTVSSLILQIVTMVCGFILPRMILQYYGSAVNGLVNSITQFLSIISFLELGVGAVVQSALYDPLAIKDIEQQSKIYASAQAFFKRIAQILLIYVCVLVFLYPYISNQNFGFIYTAVLIIAMSISSFAQYYFGIVNSLFLTADQKGYIQYNIQTITLIINTICCVVLMNLGCSIHFVKLITSLIYLARPVYLDRYVRCHYKIDKKVTYLTEPIKQKWNGIAQHVAAIVLDGTDSIVLTVFSDLKAVSVYSVYYLVVSSIKQMFNAVTNGIQVILGDLYAKKEFAKLEEVFKFSEWIIHNATVLIMGCVACLITPFVLWYTRGIKDTNYNHTVFGYILTLSYAIYCLRLPYHMMVKASGEYKETQINYVISAILNLVVSVFMVKKYGLIGVAVGTLIAMMVQTFGLAVYNSTKIMHISYCGFIKQIVIDIVICLLGMCFCNIFKIEYSCLWMLILSSVKVLGIWCIVIIVINVIFYYNNSRILILKVKNRKL